MMICGFPAWHHTIYNLKPQCHWCFKPMVGHALQKLSTWESMIQPDPGLSEDYEAWSSWWGSSRPLFLDVGGVLRVKDPPNLFPCSKWRFFVGIEWILSIQKLKHIRVSAARWSCLADRTDARLLPKQLLKRLILCLDFYIGFYYYTTIIIIIVIIVVVIVITYCITNKIVIYILYKISDIINHISYILYYMLHITYHISYIMYHTYEIFLYYILLLLLLMIYFNFFRFFQLLRFRWSFPPIARFTSSIGKSRTRIPHPWKWCGAWVSGPLLFFLLWKIRGQHI